MKIMLARTVYPIALIAISVGLNSPAPASAFAADSLPAESQPADSSVIVDQITYKQTEHNGKPRDLHIDWTRPADWQATDTRPAVVFFHGGGWVGGKPGQFEQHSEELAKRGMVCFRVEYRLLDKGNNLPPATCVEDASDAFCYVRANAERLGIDANRIGAGGGSAGGHLAAYLGMMDDAPVDGVSRKPDALMLFNPVYDNGPGGWGTKRVGEQYLQYSPAHNISSDDPPSIVFLGDNDRLVPVPAAERFQRLCHEAGLKSELRIYEGQPHGFFNASKSGGEYYRKTLAETIAFLQEIRWIE
ncbi:alpha/beta hydrolase [Rhodopirellula sallentina]|uniref:Lipase/esterase n=1 Tax=Rhodopirellula sallentina SM41 TaxID=1263870 RepID=M5UDE6_9BACT|nr:alpha/beta hydrolase [Rhodopirellula sallentina]EMI54028.1 lipase/esterase [Rhodopirellula sallentina SM41]